MKILMLGWELPPHNSGGLGIACYQLCKAMAKRGADIEFVLPYTADHQINFMAITAAHTQTPGELLANANAYASQQYHATGPPSGIHAQVKMYERSVAKLVINRSYDVIHAHDWLTFRAALRAKETLGCPIVLHVHSVERDRAGGKSGNPLCREIEETSFLLADQIVTVSQHTKNMIVHDYGISEKKISVVHNSIEPDELEPVDGETSYRYLQTMHDRGYRIVVSVSRLTVQKGLPNLLRAAKEVIGRAPKTLFVIVGSGEQYFELIELAAELGISKNVIFTGFLRGKPWRDAYAVADLFVMPSVSEPFGLTALEAIGYGTPSLITKQSGVAEVMRNCLKVDYWDIHALANKITAVVQNDSLRDSLHQNALQEFNKLSWQDSAVKLLDIYGRHKLDAGALI